MNAPALDQARLRQRLLSAAVSASPVAIFVVDAAGSIVFAEGGAVGALFGGKPPLAGARALEASAETPALVSAIAQGLEGHRFGENLTIGERLFSVRLIPLQAGDGLVAGLAGMALESTHATLEQDSSGLAEILGALLETLPLSAWVLDHRGDVVRDNGHAREHGLEAVRTSREDGPSGRSLVGRVLLEGRETAGVARVRDGSGGVVRLRVQGVPLRNSKGMTVGAVLTAEPSRLPPAPPSIADLLPPTWDPFAGGGGTELAWA